MWRAPGERDEQIDTIGGRGPKPRIGLDDAIPRGWNAQPRRAISHALSPEHPSPPASYRLLKSHSVGLRCTKSIGR